jgi:hypothetical protein
MEKIEILILLQERESTEKHRINVDDIFEQNSNLYYDRFMELKDEELIEFYPAFYTAGVDMQYQKNSSNIAILKLKGRDYIEGYLSKKKQEEIQASQASSVVKTNQSVISTNRWMKILTGLTVVISLTSLIKQCSQENHDAKLLDKFEEQLVVQQLLLKSYQTRIDSMLHYNRRDTIMVKVKK